MVKIHSKCFSVSSMFCFWYQQENLILINAIDDTFMNDRGVGGGAFGGRIIIDPFSSPFHQTKGTDNIFSSLNRGIPGASRSVSTTTSIVNGRKHTITKIQDASVSH